MELEDELTENEFTPLEREAIYAAMCPTELHKACFNGNVQEIEKLLSADAAEVNTQDKEGYTPLLLAVANGHPLAVEALLKIPRIDINIPSVDGITPLHEAAMQGMEAMVKISSKHPP